jgi:catechol 2,3-dioxygenase-like lactoylglutathione lyase family enzyme
MGAIAQNNPPVAPPSGVTQQLQWSEVDVDASQFKALRDFAVKALGMRLAVDQPNFAVLTTANGSLFEIYGPGSSDRPWRHGQGGLAVGFLTDDIAVTLKAIQKSGGVLLGVLNVLPKAGVDRGDYSFLYFRTPDNRVYAIVQNENYHAH